MLRLKRRDKAPPNPQEQSPLFATLPTEIRLKIFTLTLKCSPIPLAQEGPRNELILTLQSPGIGGPQVTAVRNSRLLRLLLSCARAYAEALPLLYGINTFSIGDPVALQLLANRASGPLVRHLDFSWTLSKPPIPVPHSKGLKGMFRSNPPIYQNWANFQVAMRKFGDLKWLRLEFSVPLGWTDGWQEREAEILMPLKDLLKEGAYGELTLTWLRGKGQTVAAEELLKGWVIKRRVW